VNSDIHQNDFFFKKGVLSYSGEKSLRDLKSLFGESA
jgi:glutamyl/glutaminyl-tRNA synthetase